MEHLSKQQRQLAYAPDGTVLSRTVTQPRHRAICTSSDCGHPRSEHHSSFDRESNDYQYGKCTVFDCLCRRFVDSKDAPESGVKETEESGVEGVRPSRCSICGADSAHHLLLGDECLKNCEANWRELEAVKLSLEASRRP